MKNNIKALRQTRGITQAELALRTGVGIPQVSKWENGRVDIPASRLTEIANVLGTTADMLLRSDYVPRYLSTVQHSRTMPGSNEGEPVETDRKSVGSGKGVSVRLDRGGRRIIK